MRHLFARICVALSVFTVAPAMAAGSASATISGFSVRLIDLNPTDGITPSISFEPGSFFVDEEGLSGFVSSYIEGSFGSFDDFSSSLTFSPISSSLSQAGATASAAISGNETLPGTTLSAAATTSDLVAGASSRQIYASGNSDLSSIFKLSGNTLAVFSVRASASLSGAGGYVQGPSGQYFGDQGSAEADIYVSGPGALNSEGGYQESSDEFEFFNFNNGEGALPFDFSGTEELSATFLNLTGGTLSGELEFDASAYVSTSTAPVPEPGTYALLLAGLGMMGFVASRRRS